MRLSTYVFYLIILLALRYTYVTQLYLRFTTYPTCVMELVSYLRSRLVTTCVRNNILLAFHSTHVTQGYILAFD